MYSSFLICLVKTMHSNTIPCLFYFLNMTFFAHEILVLCYSSIFCRFLVSFADQTIPSDSLNKMLKTGQKNIPFVDPRLFVDLFFLNRCCRCNIFQYCILLFSTAAFPLWKVSSQSVKPFPPNSADNDFHFKFQLCP